MQELCNTLLARNGLTIDDVDWLIPHQANQRIITAVADRLGLPLEKTVINIDKFGNTTRRHHPPWQRMKPSNPDASRKATSF